MNSEQQLRLPKTVKQKKVGRNFGFSITSEKRRETEAEKEAETERLLTLSPSISRLLKVKCK